MVRTSDVAAMLLFCLVVFVLTARGVTIVDTDGSLDQLLAIAQMLQPMGDGSSLDGKVPLIIVTSTGGGATHPSAAIQNVLNFLNVAKSGSGSGVVVALGADSSWRDQINSSTGLGDCTDTLRTIPRSPDDLSAPSQPFSQFDEDSLFGVAESIEQVRPPTMDLQAAATAQIINLISRTTPWERIDYVAFGALTTLATFLRANEKYDGAMKLNVHIVSVRDKSNYELDPLAAQYVLAFPGLYRKVYLPALLQPFATPGEDNWAAFTELRSSKTVPRAIKWLVDAFAAKAALYENVADNLFHESQFGPTAVFGAFCAVDGATKSALPQYKIAVVSVIEDPSRRDPLQLNITAISAAGHDPQESITFDTAFPSTAALWSRLLLELRQSKQWMGL